MNTLSRRAVVRCAVVACVMLMSASTARAMPILLNGGFESGFASWTRADQLGSEGTFALQSGTASPVNGQTVPAPTGGVRAAMTDAEGPGSHVLYQDFIVPFGATSADLSFDLFIGNRAGDFFSPSTLDFSTPELNQQARVDIMRAGSDPFSVAPADVLLTVFQTQPGDPSVVGYTTETADLLTLFTTNAGNTLRLRFAETENLFIFQMGVDNVSVDVDTGASAVPEPGTMTLLGAGLLGIGARARRRRRESPHAH